MIARLARRLLCRTGHHDPVRCAGAADHHWTWRDGRWHAEIRRPLPWLTPSTRRLLDPPATRSADLPCRCDHRQDQHRPVTDGGCTACACLGFALTGREELDIYRAVRAPGQDVHDPTPPAGKNDHGLVVGTFRTFPSGQRIEHPRHRADS